MKLLAGALVVLIGLTSIQSVVAAQDIEQARSPLLYGLSSFLIPGLGQLLQDEDQKAAIHFGVALLIPIAGAIASWVSPVPDLVLAITGVGSVSWAFLSAVDAYRLAKDFNAALGID